MAESIFAEKKVIPSEEVLSAALRDNRVLWNKTVALSGGSGEWKFYTKAAGWTYQVKQGKRALFYMIPKVGSFRLIFVYGKRAVEAAKSAGLPEQVMKDLLEAKVYAEGRSISVTVNGDTDMYTVQKLLTLKQEY